MKNSVSSNIFSKMHGIAFDLTLTLINIGMYVCTLECVHRPKMKKYHTTSTSMKKYHYCPLKLFHASTSKDTATFYTQEELLKV